MPLREAAEGVRIKLKVEASIKPGMEIEEALEIIEEQKEKIEELEKELVDVKRELDVAELALADEEEKNLDYRNDPDPYGYHGLDLTHRLEAIGVDLNA